MLTAKLMLASDWDPAKQRYPAWISPKIDGVRAANFDGTMRGRSLKTHRNAFFTDKFSNPAFQGLDGEAVTSGLTDPALCRKTSSALSTKEGTPNAGLCAFDYITPATVKLPYRERYELLKQFVENMAPQFKLWVYIVPVHVVNNEAELLALEEEWLAQGYEGVIIRDPDKPYKHGRSTVKEGGLLRIKRFVEEEALITGITEGETNLNDPQINERGLQYRTSHKENKVPNGMLGNLTGTLLKDVLDPVTKTVLFKEGDSVTISPGAMTEAEKVSYFNNPDKIVGHVIKFKFFPKGVKDKPRFPNYVCHRDPVDMG